MVSKPDVVVIYGPQGCGKSANADQFLHEFSYCSCLVDDWDGCSALPTGALALTNVLPPFDLVDVDLDDALVFSFDEAMAMVNS